MDVTGNLGKRGTSAALAVAIVATLGVGTAAAVTRGGGVAGIGASRHVDPAVAQRAYLAKLAPIADRVYLAVSPAQHVLNSIDLPHVGDAFASRDALANGGALAKVTAARKSLASLKAPAGLTAQRNHLLNTTRGVISALKALHGLRSDNDGRHLMSRVTKLGARFTVSAGNFDTAIDAAYKVVHRTAPKRFSIYRKAPVSQTSWILGADRACSQAAFKLTDLSKYQHPSTLAAIEGYDRLWAHGLALAGHRLTAVARPHGAAKLPHTLLTRLRVLQFGSKAFSKQLAGLHSQSVSMVTAAGSQIHDLQPSLRSLGKDLRSYGAVDCGQIVGIWGGNKNLLATATSSAHHHRSLNT